jgi:ElaB/YqjD/DUF883 family membrane-anchored ribosome-binding protein
MTTELIAGKDTGESAKDKLVQDIKGVVSDADYLLKDVASSTAAGFSAARAHLGTRLADARYRFDDARTAVADRARVAADATHEYVQDNPWKVLGLAAAVGLLIGVVISRRDPAKDR